MKDRSRRLARCSPNWLASQTSSPVPASHGAQCLKLERRKGLSLWTEASPMQRPAVTSARAPRKIRFWWFG